MGGDRMDHVELMEEMNRRAATIQANIKDLMARFDGLKTYQDAASWDSDAEAVVRALEDFRAYIQKRKSEFQTSMQQGQADRKKLPALKRAFTRDKDAAALRKYIKGVDDGLESIDPAIETIRAKSDLTPTSKAEQKQIAAYIKTQKKDLQIAKRQATSNIRDTHSAHRARMVGVTGIHGNGVMGSLARWERTSARMERERKLAPLEGQRRILEQQINFLDKRLIWLSSFTGSDPSAEEVAYCGYCGRRTIKGKPCPGCGSVQP